MKDCELILNTDKDCYEYNLKGFKPKVEYIVSKTGEIYLTHTEVPFQLEGKGIGTSLVRDVLTDIEQRGLKLVPLCPFITRYIRKHPQWRKLLMEGFEMK